MPRFAKELRAKLEALLPPLIEGEGLQQWKAAERLGVSIDWVERACKRLKLKTQRTGPRSGQEHPNWKGGRVRSGDYWYRYCPEHPHATEAGYVAEHRLVMEGVLGRFLEPAEVVHHKNGKSNDPENLQVFSTNAEHLRHELSGHVPNWTVEGLARMEVAIQKSANLRRLKVDDDPRTRTIDRSPSKP